MFEQIQGSKSVDSLPSQWRHHGVNSHISIGHTIIKKSASTAQVFPVMANHYLLLVGQLCNEGYTVTFRIESVTIHNSQGIHILRGAQDLDTGIWRINLRKKHKQPQQEVSNNVYELRTQERY
jgi:hypothetical protein